MNKFFSKASISQLESEINDQAQQLCDKILRTADTKEPFDVATAYSCFTSDVFSRYCFGESFGFLEQPTFEPNFRQSIYAVLSLVHYVKFFPWIKYLSLLRP